MKKRALISVFDKTGILEFAQFLNQKGVEIISTGGTYKFLKENGLSVIDVSEVTNFKEMLDGRVKTLHPNIHGGILAIRDNREHMDTISKEGIETIDYVVVNLYPFFREVQTDKTFNEKIEFIDIGGPTMLRSAANHSRTLQLSAKQKTMRKLWKKLKIMGKFHLKQKKDWLGRCLI